MGLFELLLGLVVIGAAIYAVTRGVDVRLALILAAFVLGALAGQPAAILQKFFSTLADEKYLVPICSAMGFAYVLRHTACDQHLVQLLCSPLRRARSLLIPGAVLVGFIVNIPIISQTSTAVAIGSVLIPLMYAAGLSPLTSGAALLLGSSIGGELLNPGAPEYGTVVKAISESSTTAIARTDLVNHTRPLDFLHLFVATAVFWWICSRAEARLKVTSSDVATATVGESIQNEDCEPEFKVNLLKAAVPFVPLVLLFLCSKAFEVITIPQTWLVGAKELADLTEKAAKVKGTDLFDSRLIGVAMLIGVAAAALTTLHTGPGRKEALAVAKAFFEGAGFAFAEIIAIIVAATCFAEGVKLIGVGKLIGDLAGASPALLLPTAGLSPAAFGALSGSGMAATQGLFEFFVDPARARGIDPAFVGSIVSLGAAAGRTMSPVAAVVLMCARMTDTKPMELVKRVALPLLFGLVALIVMGMLTAAPVPP